MKIAILGYGKMGKHISNLAIERGHKIVVTSSSKKPANTLDLHNVDVAIDFSTPSCAFENILHAIKEGIPTISGTTGWLDRMEDIKKLCRKENGAFLYASNFSLGMNIFFELNKQLAKLMKNQNYETKIHEIHHIQKLDSPSGTAKMIAKEIDSILQKKISIIAERIDDIPGTHIVSYTSLIDEIELKHTAKNRDGFALGALLAAKWIIGKKGVFNMHDVIKV